MRKLRKLIFFPFIILESIMITLIILFIKNNIINILIINTFVIFDFIFYKLCYKKTIKENRKIYKNFFKLLSEKDKMIKLFKAKLQDYADEKDISINELKKQLDFIITNIKPKSEAIPVFCNQLSEVIKQTDEAASHLILSFMDINKNVKKQSEKTSDFYSINDHNKDDNIFNVNKKVLNNLLVNFGNTTNMIKEISSGIKAITNKLDGIYKVIRNIEDLQEKTYILSINAGIVASHQGEKGNAFTVVVSEIRKLSENTKLFVTEIKTIVNNAIKESKEILMNSENSLKKNIKISNNDNKEILNLVDKIDNTINTIGNNFSSLKSMTDDLASNINNIVVSIQFQDITRQKIEHVIEPLDHFYKELNASLGNFSKIENHLIDEKNFNMEQWIGKYYTMENEREILRKTIKEQINRS